MCAYLTRQASFLPSPWIVYTSWYSSSRYPGTSDCVFRTRSCTCAGISWRFCSCAAAAPGWRLFNGSLFDCVLRIQYGVIRTYLPMVPCQFNGSRQLVPKQDQGSDGHAIPDGSSTRGLAIISGLGPESCRLGPPELPTGMLGDAGAEGKKRETPECIAAAICVPYLQSHFRLVISMIRFGEATDDLYTECTGSLVRVMFVSFMRPAQN